MGLFTIVFCLQAFSVLKIIIVVAVKNYFVVESQSCQ